MSVISAFVVPHPPLIIPEIGRGQEKGIQATINSYEKVAAMIGKDKPDTIVVFSPHQIMYSDYFHVAYGESAKGDFSRFNAKNVKLEAQYDMQFIDELCNLAEERDIPAGPEGKQDKSLDHGTMVPLYFVNKYYTAYKLVVIGLSGLPFSKHYELGQCVKQAADSLNRRVVIIASGDLSHKLKEDGPYGFIKEGPEYDKRVTDVLSKAGFRELFDFQESFCERAAECGHRSFILMAGALDKTNVNANLLSYEGPFGVGYCVCAFNIIGPDTSRNFKDIFEESQRKIIEEKKENEDSYVSLARTVIEEFVRNGRKIPVPDGLPEEMYTKRAGAFVSIHKDGRLRGCIGTISSTRNSIAEEIIENAISASTKDPRFYPIETAELASLDISVDILGDTERISSKDELDVKRYGVIVTKGLKRGLLLPNLDGVDTVDEQISIAKQKAGIAESEKTELERFEVVRHY